MALSFTNDSADTFVAGGGPIEAALPGCTHIGVGAHPDDLEFMAFHGIVECFYDREKQFAGIVCTDGAGCARTGPYAGLPDHEMRRVRRAEQHAAAVAGRYRALVQLDYASSAIKGSGRASLVKDLAEILQIARPEILYTHNPADNHDTHVAVFAAVMEAVRGLPLQQRPRKVLGCEVWRSLDWLLPSDRTSLDVSGHENLSAALNGVFDTQIAGGKRYDLAVPGRWRANATFLDSHQADQAGQVALAMDLTCLVRDETIDIFEYVKASLSRFSNDVLVRLQHHLGPDGNRHPS